MQMMLKYELEPAATDNATRSGTMDEGSGCLAARVRLEASHPATEDGRCMGYLVFDVAELGGWLMDALAAFEPHRPSEPAPVKLTALRGPGGSETQPIGSFGPTTPPSAPSVALHRGLTRRESEVLLLVAEGMPNRAIAEQLFLSPRTVEKHVERLLSKTGSGNRAQLVSYALRADAS